MDGFLDLIANHPLWFLLLVGAIFTAVWLVLLRDRLRMKWWIAIPIAMLHTAFGVLAVKIFAFLETGFDSDSLGNMSLFGGVFLMPVAYLLGAKISKRPPGEVCDLFTPCMIVTVMCARINCIVSGCCKGVLIPGTTTGMRFPTREAEILFYVVLLAILCPKIWQGKTGGKAYPIYMVCYGIFRFIIEFFRVYDGDLLFHRAHLWAVVALIIGSSFCSELSVSKKKNDKERRKKKWKKKF